MSSKKNLSLKPILRQAKQFRPLSVTPGVEVSPLVTRALTPGGGASPAAALNVRCVLAHDNVIVSTDVAYY